MDQLEIKAYFSVNAVATFGRALPQAILTPLLVSKGLSYDDILATQIVYMIVLAGAEYPSGLIADRVAKKYVYLSAIAVTAIAYALVWSGRGLPVLMTAWAAYGLSSALTTSTLDVHFAARLRHDADAFRAFFSTDRIVVLVATMAGALASSFLYPELGDGIYCVSIAAFFLALIGGAIALPRARQDKPVVEKPAPDGETRDRRPGLRRTIRDDPRVIWVVLLGAMTQLGMTPFFQLWQIVALEASAPPPLFGTFFIASQLLNVLANVIFTRWTPSSARTAGLLVAMVAVGATGLLSPGLPSLVLLALLPVPLFLYVNQLEFTLQSIAPARTMSSVVSFLGTANTIVSFLTLVVVFIGLRVIPPYLVLWTCVICFSASSALLLIAFRRSPSGAPLRDAR